jgi:hypothetical protein
MSVSRRSFLKGGACAICAALGEGSHTEAIAKARAFNGCMISAETFAEYKLQQQPASSPYESLFARDKYLHTTGDPLIDRDLDHAMAIVADLMGIKPAFGFYNPTGVFDPSDADTWRMNAWATQEDSAIAGTHGTVCFSKDLFRTEFYEIDRTGTTIIAIIAHEFGHIVQGNRGYLGRISRGFPLGSEINADFLAGYFLGTRKAHNPSLSFEKAGEMFIRFGRQVDGNPLRTHGDSKERIAAAEAGFRAALVRKKSFDEAVAEGLEYVGG